MSVGQQTTCTATVTDTASTGQTTPTGTVSFSSDSPGSFGSGGSSGSCPLSSAGGASSSCLVSYTPSSFGSGTHTIFARYSGDATHQLSTTTEAITVFPLCGSSTTITGGPSLTTGISVVATQSTDSRVVAQFSGPSGPSSAQIDWGDGTPPSAGFIQPAVPGPGCYVLGSHTYGQPGHFTTRVTVTIGSEQKSFGGVVFGVSPPSAPAPSAVGVLTADNPGAPQCTATVVDLAHSFDPGHPEVYDRIQKYKNQFNGDVVVTAAHCVLSGSGQPLNGLMFAPGFTGLAPRHSVDFTTGTVSADTGPYGSQFAGRAIGSAPLGVWGCSENSESNQKCGVGGLGEADVIAPDPKQISKDQSLDYAFVVFHTAPQNQSKSLLQVAGGLPIWFDPVLTTARKLVHPGYDINWLDASKPGDTAGWFDLTKPPEKTVCDVPPPAQAPFRFETCPYKYIPFSSTAGPRTCSPTFDEFADPRTLSTATGGRITRPDGLATPCNLNLFSSGAPFLLGNPGSVIVGVTKAAFYASDKLDPYAAIHAGPAKCCTAQFTPLYTPDAFQNALGAERRGGT